MTPSFPSGAVGLAIAAVLAASLSSIDSAINSCTSVLVIDVYQRFVRPRDAVPPDDRHQVGVSRLATVLFGTIGTLLATIASPIGTLLGPTLLAGIVGTLTSYVVAYQTPIGFMRPSTFGLEAAATGWELSQWLPGPTEDALRLTWWQVMRREEAAVRS